MDAHPEAGAGDHLGDRLGELQRKLAAIGVAQHDDVSAGAGGGIEHPQRRVGVVPVAVEEVLAVQEHPAPVGDQQCDGVLHHGHVLFHRGPQRSLDVPAVGLGDQRHDGCLRVEQGTDLRVVGGSRLWAAGGAERDERGVPQL
jgi:hypothetical protein